MTSVVQILSLCMCCVLRAELKNANPTIHPKRQDDLELGSTASRNNIFSFHHSNQTGSMAHPASCLLGTWKDKLYNQCV